MMHPQFLRSERSMLDFQLLNAGQSLPSNHPLYQRAAQLGDEIQRQQQQVDQLVAECVPSQYFSRLVLVLKNCLVGSQE